MNKKVIISIVTVSMLFGGFGKPSSANAAELNAQSPLAVSATSSIVSAATTISYSQYAKKTWIDKKGTSNFSFSISSISNGKVTGSFAAASLAVPNQYDLGQLTGTVKKDTASCQFSDTIGNKGTLKLVFKASGEIQATLKLTNKSKYTEQRPKEGTFQFKRYNIKDIGGFVPIKSQSFTVTLNSWGKVNFVSGKLTGGSHVPTVFYLTDKDGNLLYDFSNTFAPYSTDVRAVSFPDVNKDGLKDIIIIVSSNYNGTTEYQATIMFQKTNGAFPNDPKLDQEINSSGHNKTIKEIRDYLAKKF